MRRIGSVALVAVLAASGIVACERRDSAEEEFPLPSAPLPDEDQAAPAAGPLSIGSEEAFGIPLPEGTTRVIRDTQMETFRIAEDLDAVLAFLQRHAPPHDYRREGGRHQLVLSEHGLTIHVYPEGGVVRVAALRGGESPEREVHALAEQEGRPGDEAEREGPRRIVMEDPDGTPRGRVQGGSIPVRSEADRPSVPGARSSVPLFLEEPGGRYSEMFHVPPGYLPNLPRDGDGYLRLHPSPEQRQAIRSMDGRAPRYFVPSNPAAGF